MVPDDAFRLKMRQLDRHPCGLSMTSETRVLYNDTCPVCRFEIDAYRRRALADRLPIRFDNWTAPLTGD